MNVKAGWAILRSYYERGRISHHKKQSCFAGNQTGNKKTLPLFFDVRDKHKIWQKT